MPHTLDDHLQGQSVSVSKSSIVLGRLCAYAIQGHSQTISRKLLYHLYILLICYI
jgi:hypothetical protein